MFAEEQANFLYSRIAYEQVFSNNTFVIDEIIAVFKLSNAYKVIMEKDRKSPLSRATGKPKNFEITDTAGQKIGTIDMKWNGMAKELFTTANKYAVKIKPSVNDENPRVAVASVAATIDVILKEGRI